MHRRTSWWYAAVFVLTMLVTGAIMSTLSPSRAAPSVEPPIPPVIDTSPPGETLKLVFVHASVGQQWLSHWLGGRDDMPAYWDMSLGGNNYHVSDAFPLPGFPGHGYCDWYDIFTDEEHLNALFQYNGVTTNYDPIADPGGENDIIMIKPCYIEYPILGNPDDPPSGEHGCPGDPDWNWYPKTVGNVKQALLDILEVFRGHPDKFFVLVTAPPKPEGEMEFGENARAIANWMVNDWLDGYDVGNVMVFDLYNVLTSNAEGEGDACQEWETYPVNPESGSDVGQERGNHHRIWEGEVQHQVESSQYYSAYCYGHPPKQATYKMTKEFVPLLNVYVNAWLAGEEPMPSKSVNPPSARYGEAVNYTISVIGTGQPITVTDPLPSGLSYVPGSASVLPEVGILSVDGGVLRWTGTVTADASLDIGLAAVVEVVTTTVIRNTAFVDDDQGVSELSAILLANPRHTFLPTILRDH